MMYDYSTLCLRKKQLIKDGGRIHDIVAVPGGMLVYYSMFGDYAGQARTKLFNE